MSPAFIKKGFNTFIKKRNDLFIKKRSNYLNYKKYERNKQNVKEKQNF